MPRFKENDFKTKSIDGVGTNWPLNYDDLNKYFELNEKRMGLAGKNDPAYPKIKNFASSSKPGRSGELILKTFRSLNGIVGLLIVVSLLKELKIERSHLRQMR